MKRLASRFDVVAYAAPQEHLAVNAAERERPAMDHIGIDVHKRESQIWSVGNSSTLRRRAPPACVPSP